MPKNAQSTGNTAPDHLAEISIDAIVIGEQQLRHDPFDEAIGELALDIQAKGLLQPIGLLAIDGGRYQLLFGSRRLAAHQRLKRPSILARIFQTSPGELRAVALVENLQRADLTLAEECDAVRHLHETDQRSPEQIASLLSKSRAWVMRRLAVPQLPDDLRAPLLRGELSLGAAEEIARLEDPAQRAYLANQSRQGFLTVPEIRDAVTAALSDAPLDAAVETAVQAGLAAVDPPTIHLTCARCGRPRPIPELTIVRICSTDCSAQTETHQ